MANNKKRNIWIAALSALGIIGFGIAYSFRKKPVNKKEDLNDAPTDNATTPNPQAPSSSPQVSAPPTYTSSTSSSGGSSISYFTNQADGDAFRAWVNDTYPSYAKSINLDRTGSYNNKYINAAYQKYGAAYLAYRTSKPPVTVSSNKNFENIKKIIGPVYYTISKDKKTIRFKAGTLYFFFSENNNYSIEEGTTVLDNGTYSTSGNLVIFKSKTGKSNVIKSIPLIAGFKNFQFV